MKSYMEAAEFLGKKSERPLSGKSTRLRRLDDYRIGVVYHATPVVIYHRNGQVELNTGGWYSVTTKQRFGEYSPARVYSTNGVWYVFGPSHDWDAAPSSEYYDGIKVRADGTPIKPLLRNKTVIYKRALDRLTCRYIKEFVADAKANGLKNPDGCDCWICMLAAPKTGDGGPYFGTKLTAPIGEEGVDHILKHIAEKYYVPRLLWNAVMLNCRDEERAGRYWGSMRYDVEHRDHGGCELMERALRGYFKRLKPALLKMFAANKGKLPASD